MKARPVLVALAVVLSLLPMAGAPAAAVPSRTALPMRDARDVVVDPGTGRVFVAGDDVVAVRAPDGSALATIPAMYRVRALVAGGGSIWALVAGTTSVARIDPQTMKATGSWSLAPRTAPVGLAWADGRVWTSTEVNPVGRHALVSLDPATGAVADEYTNRHPMLVTSSPAAPGVVVGADYGSSGGTVSVFDVDGPEVTLRAEEALDGFIRDIAIGGGGTTVLKGNYELVEEFRITDLATTGVRYPASSWVVGVASVDLPNEGSLVAGVGSAPAEPDFSVFRGGAPTAVVRDQVDTTRTGEGEIIGGGVALSPSGNRGYALRADVNGMAELAVVPVGPVVTTISPRVVGVRGGGTVTVLGATLNLTSVRVGGQATTGATGSATARTVTVPALPAGSAPVTVANPFGVVTSSPVPVVVRELGPFRGSGAFADRQYRDFAGRAATAAEASAADAGLAGGASAGALPVSLARSVGFADRRAPIVRLYQAIFLRPPDTAGFEYWLGRVRAGRSLTWVASAMANAPEFKTRYGSLANGAFVDRIYSNVLGRPADASGKAYWVGQLNEGKPRGTIVVGFSQSPEYRAKMADQVDVTHLYLGMLRRTPTATELAAALATTQASAITSVAVGVLTSTEYRSRIG